MRVWEKGRGAREGEERGGRKKGEVGLEEDGGGGWWWRDVGEGEGGRRVEEGRVKLRRKDEVVFILIPTRCFFFFLQRSFSGLDFFSPHLPSSPTDCELTVCFMGGM